MDQAVKVAKEFQKINKQLKLKIVGSVARYLYCPELNEEPKDIDFVTHLPLPNGKQHEQTHYKDYKIDMWQYPNVKIGQFIRTCDKGHLIAIYNGLKKNNYRLTEEGIQNLDTKKIIPFSIPKILKLADIKLSNPKICGSAKNPESGEIQSVLFDNKVYDLEQAKREFKRLGYEMPSGKLPHVTKNFIRMRVVHPNYKKYNYRTIWLADDGSIRAIYAYPKSSETYQSTRFRR